MNHETRNYSSDGSLLTQEETDVLLRSPSEVFVPSDYIPEVLPFNGEELSITVNKEHAYKTLDRLMGAYSANESPYNLDRVRLPHDPRHMPETLERGSTDHAVFLFNVCYYMRGGIKSNDAVKRMSSVYDEWPELFNCASAKDFDEGLLIDVLTQHGLGFQKTVAKQ